MNVSQNTHTQELHARQQSSHLSPSQASFATTADPLLSTERDAAATLAGTELLLMVMLVVVARACVCATSPAPRNVRVFVCVYVCVRDEKRLAVVLHYSADSPAEGRRGCGEGTGV